MPGTATGRESPIGRTDSKRGSERQDSVQDVMVRDDMKCFESSGEQAKKKIRYSESLRALQVLGSDFVRMTGRNVSTILLYCILDAQNEAEQKKIGRVNLSCDCLQKLVFGCFQCLTSWYLQHSCSTKVFLLYYA